MIGPVDFGFLTYTRASRTMLGADHYITGLAVEEDAEGECLRVHDPAGSPHALLPVADLVEAWRAERIGYKRAPFTLRAAFRSERSASLVQMIERTLPVAREHLAAAAAERGPRSFGGSHALRRLAEDLRAAEGNVPAGLERNLLGFALPTVTRRTVDASRFAEAADRADAARLLDRQARSWGRALSKASRQTWGSVADTLDELAVAEEAVTTAL
jgi:hypothetical protein